MDDNSFRLLRASVIGTESAGHQANLSFSKTVPAVNPRGALSRDWTRKAGAGFWPAPAIPFVFTLTALGYPGATISIVSEASASKPAVPNTRTVT